MDDDLWKRVDAFISAKVVESKKGFCTITSSLLENKFGAKGHFCDTLIIEMAKRKPCFSAEMHNRINKSNPYCEWIFRKNDQ